MNLICQELIKLTKRKKQMETLSNIVDKLMLSVGKCFKFRTTEYVNFTG